MMSGTGPLPDGHSPDRDHDLETLFTRYPPRAADPETVERLATRAVGRLQRRRAWRRRTMAVAGLASAAALVLLVRWPWQEVGGPAEKPVTVDHELTADPESADSGPGLPKRADTVRVAPSDDRTLVAVVREALATTVALRTTRREILRELRHRGPEVLEPLLDALRKERGETALAAAQILSTLATTEADAATRQLLAEGLEGEDLPAETAELLVEELVRRRDPAGRRLVRSLLETSSAGGFIVRYVSRAQGMWAAVLLSEATTSTSLPLASEAIGVLSHRRPREAASAFWKAAENFSAAGTGEIEPTRPRERPAGLTAFLRETLPRLSAGTLAHLGDDLRSRRPHSGSEARHGAAARDDWRAELPAALGRSRSTKAWPLLVALLEADGATPAVLRAFGALGDARALPVLERYVYLGDDRADAAIRALAEIPDPGVVRILLRAYLATPIAAPQLFPGKRALLAGALRDRGAVALPELRARYTERPDQLALSALVRLFPDEAGRELARLLPAVGPRGRPQVFRALASLGTPEAVTILIDALGDPSLRLMARQSLTHIVRRDLGPRPESWKEWLRDHGPTPRRRAGRFDPQRGGLAPVLVVNDIEHQKEEV